MGIKTKRFIASRKSCSCSMPGVWRAVAHCQGFVVIFHSPRACAHVARTMDINSHFRSLADEQGDGTATIPLLSSQLEEKHTSFGGAERLEKCITYAVEKYTPQCIVIANSCVAGVIGDDVVSVARDAQEKYQLPILTVDSYGFLDGEYYEGYFFMTENLIDHFVKLLPKEKKTVVLLGDNGGPWGHYAKEVTRLLNALGIKVIGQFPGYMSFDEIQKLGRAEGCIVLGGRGHTYVGLNRLARKLYQQCDIKYLANIYPLGWHGTERWLQEAADLFECSDKASEIIWQERQSLLHGLSKYLPVTRGKATVLCIGRWLMYFHPAGILEIIKMLQLDLKGIILLDAYDEAHRQEMLELIRSCTDKPIYSTKDGEELLSQADLVLTTHELQNPELKQIFLPMLPQVGTTGALHFMEIIYRTMRSRLQQGGVVYV